ncbi:MAG: AMP-dependent synthetase [SAR324 cluster bacterium]|uniref:AMP-dependent synthetase n=1 Tax=SAR324 cluster bacterium TaxID=2024889 RepID=A0A2A4T625_9DELT|nr:MAG: AMP-dependent synthetase [SAR324 cluster bacterium]
MIFIRAFDNTDEGKRNILTDGLLTCTYQEIPAIFSTIKRVFKQSHIAETDCLVLECENSLPCVLVLLYLLENGYSFLLVAKTNTQSNSLSQVVSPPKFCRYTVTINMESTDSLNPESFLQFSKNERWDGEIKASRCRKKLYMKTSGSTGAPKMAEHSHSALFGNISNCIKRLEINKDARIAIPVPVFHMFGLGAAFLPGVAVGASIDLQKGANILRYLQRERVFNPNIVFMTPIFAETFIKARRSSRQYHFTVTAGDRIRETSFLKYEALFGKIVQLYGSTELGAITASSPKDPKQRRAQTAGKPMEGVRMHLEEGKISKLWCNHPFGFEGYIDEAGERVSTTPQENDGWFCTKDLGCIHPDHRVEVLGRQDHAVNRDGLLVFFSDVEKAIEAIEGIDSIVIISNGEAKRGKRLIACCIIAKTSELTVDAIRNACLELLPKRAVPDEICILDSMPLLPNGKVDRVSLSKENLPI